MSTSFRLVYEEDGFPRELLSSSDWKAAVHNGRLTPETRVTMYRHGEMPVSLVAAQIAQLRPLFGLDVLVSLDAEVDLPQQEDDVPLHLPAQHETQEPQTAIAVARAWKGRVLAEALRNPLTKAATEKLYGWFRKPNRHPKR
jgi:hypothetical protein